MSLFAFSFLTITVISYVFLEVHAAIYIKFEHAFISIMIGAICKFAVYQFGD